MDSPVRPPIDGTLTTLLDFLDFSSKHNATAPYVIFPSMRDSQSMDSVSFEQMATATHSVAHTLRPGRLGPNREVVAILVHTDVPLYIAIFLGIMRAGWIVSSPIYMAMKICLTSSSRIRSLLAIQSKLSAICFGRPRATALSAIHSLHSSPLVFVLLWR